MKLCQNLKILVAVKVTTVPIEQYLNRQRTRYLRDHRGRPAYPLLSMFKAVLLGQWHSLSDPELEHSLITRIDFNLFCRFDELSIPDYSTLCRYRNWLAQDDTVSELLELINRQLTEKGRFCIGRVGIARGGMDG